MNLLLGIFLGALWGIANLYLTKQLLETILLPTPNKNLKILIFTLIKFPLLYGAGYGLLRINSISPWDLLIGFTTILSAAVIYWFGRNIERVKKVQ